MTKKHFEAFAREIAVRKKAGYFSEKETIKVKYLVAEVAKQFNPNFDEGKFIKRIEVLSK